MELRALRYFVTVAEELHFGRAADRLAIAQPAVSQQVARLERELGVRLLDRSPRHVRLTDAGQRVLDAARETLASVDRVRIAAGGVTTVRIGTAPGLTRRLESGVEALRVAGTWFDVVLVDLPVAARLRALRRGDIDLALARGGVAGAGLSVREAWTEPLHAVVSVRHPLASRAALAPGDLAGSVLRLPSRRCDPPLHDAVLTALDQAGARPRLGRPAASTQATVVEVGADAGTWAVLPAEQLADAPSTRVRVIPFDPPLTVAGQVITRADDGTPGHCADVVVEAFRHVA
ncbi:LysR family transcriptional regulator [Amycolatopsis thermophila]|uniref:DNA-binding transcriptional LysR family regulator n=1 Tax=Amycolatopsis thermophila TaxID=206084 RepID=A0ABU0ELS7_9PSEU|nr:LysR family transcriptional regulator [Amycolatopsis thermophila]MDQ0376134.1 DNA-binding transcriptional LysR family regulator [Amycolatopsis thermophila]